MLNGYWVIFPTRFRNYSRTFQDLLCLWVNIVGAHFSSSLLVLVTTKLLVIDCMFQNECLYPVPIFWLIIDYRGKKLPFCHMQNMHGLKYLRFLNMVRNLFIVFIVLFLCIVCFYKVVFKHQIISVNCFCLIWRCLFVSICFTSLFVLFHKIHSQTPIV